MKHKHYETILAYAEGKQIQYQNNHDGKWIDTGHPSFYDAYEYRVKPEPKPDVIKYTIIGVCKGGYHHTPGVYFRPPLQTSFDDRGHFTVVGKIKLTFDGETGKLKVTEVVE